MTGTAETEAAEFHSTYKLDVIVIPTHMPMVRKDNPDVIYRTLPEKWDAVVEEIQERYEQGQPVLVGTVSVENSELIARRLVRVGVPHNVLNAKHHEREAEIVAQAGRKGAITIATNMAGRGTDILLGGNPDFMAREFLKEQEIDPDEATDDQWKEVFARAKRIASAQKSVEGRNFETRKHLLEYDDVMNKQRETIYGLRRQLMEEPDQREYLVGETGVARDLLTDLTQQYLNPDLSPDDWDVENYKVQIHSIY